MPSLFLIVTAVFAAIGVFFIVAALYVKSTDSETQYYKDLHAYHSRKRSNKGYGQRKVKVIILDEEDGSITVDGQRLNCSKCPKPATTVSNDSSLCEEHDV